MLSFPCPLFTVVYNYIYIVPYIYMYIYTTGIYTHTLIVFKYLIHPLGPLSLCA